MDRANKIIRVIGSHGRRFLSSNSDCREPKEDPTFSRFEVDSKGELWYVQWYGAKRILVRHREWPGFCDGGTLRGVIEHLRNHILLGNPVRIHFAEYWGYEQDMALVAREVGELCR